jgi:uncharacterized membrane protein
MPTLNYLSIFISSVAVFALGFVWYLPAVFGNTWLEAIGKRQEDLESPAIPLIYSFVANLIMASVMQWLMVYTGCRGIMNGALLGLLLGAGLIATSMCSDYLFCGWPKKLYSIQAGYRVLSLALMGLILGAWT